MNEPTFTIHGIETDARCCWSDQTGECLVISAPTLGLHRRRYLPGNFTKLVKMYAQEIPTNGTHAQPLDVDDQ